MINDPITPAVASAAATSPWWLPALAKVSEVAAFALPILGCVWLAVQITGYLLRLRKR